jgi:hypothetical protein
MLLKRVRRDIARAACLVLCAQFQMGLLQAQYQWSCHYPNLGYPPYDGRAWEGYHSVSYISYIPASLIDGPTKCSWPSTGTPVDTPYLKYKGDAGAILYGYGPQSWRTSSTYSFSVSGYRGPFWHDPGETRNYGHGTPKIGTTWSTADEDGIGSDCYLWNASGHADNSNWIYDLTVPNQTQGQVHFSGTGSNPLETWLARIAWDMRTLIDITNLDNITAKVNYNHTCFPAHAIMVNDFLVYNYSPPRSDSVYLINCLVLQLDKVIGEQSTPTHVPCN